MAKMQALAIALENYYEPERLTRVHQRHMTFCDSFPPLLAEHSEEFRGTTRKHLHQLLEHVLLAANGGGHGAHHLLVLGVPLAHPQV